MTNPNRHMFKVEMEEAFLTFIKEKGYIENKPIPPYEVIRAVHPFLIGPTRTLVIYQRAKATGFYTLQPHIEPLFKEFLNQYPST